MRPQKSNSKSQPKKLGGKTRFEPSVFKSRKNKELVEGHGKSIPIGNFEKENSQNEAKNCLENI